MLSTILKSLRTSGNTFEVLFDNNTTPVTLNTLDSFDCRFAEAINADDETVVFSLSHVDQITDTGA